MKCQEENSKMILRMINEIKDNTYEYPIEFKQNTNS
jgi:hypothetical protein